ncbi:Calcium-dependent lipid-binding (CaLB domain) family protein [Theobroma cacao]|uniref:Calcium-dependent lipid-binding (CaLB domain) family protein n=1 Tax=Theobroma cacao TaxID=3641 RepID=A0A061GMZ0_THECC|nr:Calcium-dependent lipid-binding (CaLB domain) family protein [Theobroma cacao]
MGFIVGLLIGLVVGLGIIVLFVRSENSRSKLRNELAKTVAAFARMTVEDSRKILPAQFYPSWVVFSQRQKLNWLNQHLTKIWPYVDKAASDLIKASVEPVLEQYRPIILSSLKFSKFTLGTVAPQFTGVSIVEDGADSVTMEMEMQWDANSSIILDIKTYLGVSLPVQVKDIGFTGVFRFIFKPLVNEFPCFGAVCFSLRKKKKLDFTLKVIGGDISTIPGLSDAIESTIRDAIEDSIMWPVRKIIPILPGDYSDLELKPVGMLEVKLVQARDLTNKDIIGKSDPYAVLHVRPLPSRTKKSKTINNELNPIWNEHYEFIIEDATTQHLVVKIYDDEGVQAAELIGCAQVQLKELEPGKVKDVWLNLVKDLEIQRDTKYRGEVHLELLYCPFGTENSFTNPFSSNFSMTSLEKALKSGVNGTEVIENEKTVTQKKKEVIIRGVLSVSVISAEDLPVVDLMGKADPYVVLTMKKSEARNKTRVVNDSLNPVWNQTFDFVVEDGLHDMLILEVWDHDTFGKDYMGRCILTLTRVILEGEYKDSLQLEGAKSGKLNLYLKWMPQPIFRDS